MGIKSIKVVNLLSFDELKIEHISDINCVIGQNNAGKSNLLKLLQYFYKKLNSERLITPSLHSSYSSFGSITVVYDTTRINRIVTSKKNNSKYLKHIYNMLFKNDNIAWGVNPFEKLKVKESTYELTLKVNSDESTEWSVKDKKVRDIINFLYPFFEVETRHIDLYDWDKLWFIISRLKTFSLDDLNDEDIITFFDSSISEGGKSYSDYIDKINGIIQTSKYSYREKVLNYIKVGLKGHTFMISGEELTFQSDGTNSYKYIELLLTLLITLTRREYITPTVYIDEPETGLHPKKNEELISRLYEVYNGFKKTKTERELGKYKTPYPKIIFSTHSPNILKQVIKLFTINQQVLHFSKKGKAATKAVKMNSQYIDRRFYNVFSDNEARLFFSSFILFVEGATELELFGNLTLLESFPILNKVDVYQNNNVTLKYTNPSYSNLSIPYLVLYDADKLITYDPDKKLIEYTNKNINIESMFNRVKKSYYGSKYYSQKRSINELINNGSKTFKPDSKNISFIGSNLSQKINSINKKILLPNNYLLTATTTEGSLINRGSISLFNKWLADLFLEKFSVKSTKNTSRLISAYQAMYKSGNDIKQIFNGLLELDGENISLTDQQSNFIKFIKYKYLRKIKKVIGSRSNSEDELIILYRLVFDGKTDTLISTSNLLYEQISLPFRELVKDTKCIYFKPIRSLTSKTGGWVTRFMDYSIEHIKESNDEEGFKKEFKQSFPEIYDIIDAASSSIE